jgi:predicted PurR-regulated permease PerM
MNPLHYLKAVIAVVGANVFPPITDWLVSFIPAPASVRTALSILLVALLTGGAVYTTPNKPKV